MATQKGMSARRVATGAIVGLAVVYVVALAALYTNQRNLLFIRGREEWTQPPAGFQERVVREQDGTRLRIWESGPPEAGKPTIVFFYGNAGTLSDFAEIGEHLHEDGYGAVLASYRGFSGNPGQPSEAGLFADARSVLDSIPKSFGKIVLWGQSLGTGVAAQMAADDRGTGLVLISPYTAVVDIAAAQYPYFPVRLLDSDPFDTFALVSRIRVPVLILHGTDDRTVPFAMGKRLANAFGDEARLVPLPAMGHEIPSATILPIVRNWLKAEAIHLGS
jgi:fermentation-respiration switch protein FrsA (DUF1100 family)